MNNIQNIIIQSEQEFKDYLKNSKTFVVYFYAPWCGPCKAFGPIYEQIAKTQTIEMKKLDIDVVQDVAINYGIMSIPTLIAFKNGQEIERIVGVPQNLNAWIEQIK